MHTTPRVALLWMLPHVMFVLGNGTGRASRSRIRLSESFYSAGPKLQVRVYCEHDLT